MDSAGPSNTRRQVYEWGGSKRGRPRASEVSFPCGRRLQGSGIWNELSLLFLHRQTGSCWRPEDQLGPVGDQKTSSPSLEGLTSRKGCYLLGAGDRLCRWISAVAWGRRTSCIHGWFWISSKEGRSDGLRARHHLIRC